MLWDNALNVGVIGGVMIGNGRADVFFGLITVHGLLELTCVFIAGGVGPAGRLGLDRARPAADPDPGAGRRPAGRRWWWRSASAAPLFGQRPGRGVRHARCRCRSPLQARHRRGASGSASSSTWSSSAPGGASRPSGETGRRAPRYEREAARPDRSDGRSAARRRSEAAGGLEGEVVSATAEAKVSAGASTTCTP